MIEETSFKRLKEWIANHTRLNVTEVGYYCINAKENVGNAYIDLIIALQDSGKYACAGYISFGGYKNTRAELIEIHKTVKSEEELIKVLKNVFLATNDVRDMIWRLEEGLKD